MLRRLCSHLFGRYCCWYGEILWSGFNSNSVSWWKAIACSEIFYSLHLIRWSWMLVQVRVCVRKFYIRSCRHTIIIYLMFNLFWFDWCRHSLVQLSIGDGGYILHCWVQAKVLVTMHVRYFLHEGLNDFHTRSWIPPYIVQSLDQIGYLYLFQYQIWMSISDGSKLGCTCHCIQSSAWQSVRLWFNVGP